MLALLLSASFGAGAARADDAATVYDPGAPTIVDLTLSPTAEAELEAEPEEYVDGTFELTLSSDGTPSGEEATPLIPQQAAEIRLKGSVGGSFRELDEKPGFKLKFKKSETVLGLRKVTLNNMVQDPSMVHETLAYAAFRAAGVPASRTGFAYVRLNGEDIGVYLDLENLDDIALAKIFGSFDKKTGQHLYEGEYGDDVVPGGLEDFEIDEGNDEPGEQPDLEALIDAVNGTGEPPWSERVDPYADLIEMTRLWAVEKYIDHWDGYSGHAIPGFRPNNYYLYSDPSGRFQMLPWGTDQAWVFTEGEREVTFDGEGGVLFNKCLEDEACFRLYWEALGQATQAIPGIDPGQLAEDTDDLLAPWQAEERANGRPDPESDTAGEVEAALDESLDFIAGRQAEAEEWLEGNRPSEPIDEELTPVGPPQPAGPAGPAAATLRFRGAKLSGRRLTVHVHLSTAGEVSLRASFKAGEKRKRACATAKRAKSAGDVVLRCRLSSAALKALAQRPLRLRLAMTTVPADGGAKKKVVKSIQLARS